MPSKVTKVSSLAPSELSNRITELELTVARLERSQRKTTESTSNPGGFTQFMRRFAIATLVVLCGLTSTMSASSLWVKRNVVNTDIWVNKTSELVQDPAIRSSISTALANQIFTQADVEGRLAEVLPDRISGLSSTLSNNLETAVGNKINDALTTQAFTDFWARANRSAHQGIMDSLENGGVATADTKANSVMYVDNERLVLNLRPVFSNIQNRLVSNGLTFVGNINVNSIGGEITLTTIKRMPAVLLAIDLINKAAFVLPILAILFGAGAIALSVRKRSTLMAIGWVTAVLMVLLVQTVNLVRYPFIGASLNALESARTDAATAAYGILTNDLIMIGRTFMVIALLLVVAAFMSGESKPAVYIKAQLGKLMRTDGNQNGFIRFVRNNSGYVFGGIATVTSLLLVFPLVSGTPVYPITVVSIAAILSLFVATVRQNSAVSPAKPAAKPRKRK